MSDPTAIDVLIDPDEAVAPFTEPGGTAGAFIADPGEVISPAIITRDEIVPPYGVILSLMG